MLPMKDTMLQNESSLTPSDFTIRCPLSNSKVVSGVCDHRGGVLSSKYGDLRIMIPTGAIEDEHFVKIYIATDLYGPVFKLPNLNNLVSPYYWIGVSGSYRFRKPVQVEFEHFAAVTDPSEYQLLSCEDDDETCAMKPIDCPLKFTLQGNLSLCTFQTSHFCSYCLFYNKDQVPTNRIGAFHLIQKNFKNLNDFRTEIWFSFPIKLCIKRNTELYKSRSLVLNASYIFEASSDKNSTNYFTMRYLEDIDDWTIKHTLPKKINTEKVNFYNHYTEMEELQANEECQLFPPRSFLM